ncbi:MAG: hypothetical protein KQI78_09740 [Deltaproteobacteria bacterium]|nr:hypothetical protein [Deltaproteobacteria bacterium]
MALGEFFFAALAVFAEAPFLTVDALLGVFFLAAPAVAFFAVDAAFLRPVFWGLSSGKRPDGLCSVSAGFRLVFFVVVISPLYHFW